ncbi:kinetochore-associated Ndc80 complex subunit nuf2 [Entomophthora muscae]|uniref:Kinetochore-associated Ndc80 complex subunit nuf2 n=1 Tax=Entomophthora muscae TaxID=34485 RepID=A0ACC2RJT6_9FUNG|nr:kinetochore-associated Ndc80 complex subunit nuf2 [Entomophthora muscae]
MRNTLPPSYRASAELTPHHGNVQGLSKGPKLSAKEIIEKFSNFGLQIGGKLLRQPINREVTEIFGLISLKLTGKCLADFSVAYDEQFNLQEDLSSYRDALILLRFSKHMAWLCKKLNFNDFGIRDLLNPDPERTRSLLSTFACFFEFIQQRSTQCDDLVFKEREIKSEVQEIERIRDELNQKVLQERADLEELAPGIERKRIDSTYLYMKVKAMRLETSNIKDEIATLKVNIATVVSSNRAVKENIKEVQKESEKLKELLSKDPISLEKDVSMLKTQLLEIESKIGIFEQEVACKKKVTERLKETANRVTALTASLLEIRTERVKVKEIVSIVDALQTELHTLKSEQEDVNVQLKNLKDKRERLQNRERDCRKKEEEFQGRKSEEIKQCTDTVAKQSIEADKRAAELKAIKERRDKLEQEASSYISKIDAQFSLITRKISEAKECINVYLEALDSSLAEFTMPE